MFKTIVCAIEASNEGKAVLAKAAELAKRCDSKLFVIHVLPYTLLPKDYQKELTEEAKPKIEKLCEAFEIPKKQQAIKVGKPYSHICDFAQKKKADLIVIGTHSKKGLKALLGSTANGVVNNAECDVTIIKI